MIGRVAGPRQGALLGALLGALVTAVAASPAAAQDRPVPAPGPHCVSVRDPRYGARGDGTSDDTRALQRAIDEQPCAFLPPGVYRTSRAITVSDDRHLVGAGRDWTIVHQATAPVPGSVANSGTVYDCIWITGSRVRLSDLTLRGPAAGFPPLVPGAAGQKGISVQPQGRAERISLVRLRVEGIQTNAVSVWNGVRDLYVVDLIIRDAGNEGMYLTFDVADVTVRRLDVARVRSWGFDTNAGRVRLLGFVIRQAGDLSVADDGGGVTFTADDLSTERRSVVIANGIVEDCIGSGVNITVPQSDSLEASDVEISNVLIALTRRTVAVPGLYVSTAGGARKGRLRSATFDNVVVVNSTVNLQNVQDVMLRDCRVVNQLPLAEPGTTASAQGIRIDAGMRPDLGSVTVARCLSRGWAVGFMWQSYRASVSRGNRAEENREAGYRFAGDRSPLLSIDDAGCGNGGADRRCEFPPVP